MPVDFVQHDAPRHFAWSRSIVSRGQRVGSFTLYVRDLSDLITCAAAHGCDLITGQRTILPWLRLHFSLTILDDWSYTKWKSEDQKEDFDRQRSKQSSFLFFSFPFFLPERPSEAAWYSLFSSIYIPWAQGTFITYSGGNETRGLFGEASGTHDLARPVPCRVSNDATIYRGKIRRWS